MLTNHLLFWLFLGHKGMSSIKITSYDSRHGGVLGFFELGIEFSGPQGFKDTVFTSNIFLCCYCSARRDSSVGIATRYGLNGPGIESRWGARFSAPVQTGPRAHPASYAMGTGSLKGGKAAGAWR